VIRGLGCHDVIASIVGDLPAEPGEEPMTVSTITRLAAWRCSLSDGVPRIGDAFKRGDCRFEIVDMDGTGGSTVSMFDSLD
jgi:hypothetical protein